MLSYYFLLIHFNAAAAAKLLQSCPTPCNPIDGSPWGSPIPEILQARTLEWVAIAFSNAGKWKVKAKSLSLVRLLATPWTAAHQAPPSMGFSRQEYWSGVPLPSPPSELSEAKFLSPPPNSKEGRDAPKRPSYQWSPYSPWWHSCLQAFAHAVVSSLLHHSPLCLSPLFFEA